MRSTKYLDCEGSVISSPYGVGTPSSIQRFFINALLCERIATSFDMPGRPSSFVIAATVTATSEAAKAPTILNLFFASRT